MAALKLPIGWTWPAWALARTPSEIEVHVIDTESGESRWLPGVPEERVVGEGGCDAFLLVSYNWDGDDYVEDFDPFRVRRKHGTTNIAEDIIAKRNGECEIAASNVSAGWASEDATKLGACHGVREIVLEVESAEGVEVNAFPFVSRSVVLPVSHGDRFAWQVGRSHQPEIFERFVIQRDVLTSISRSHVQIAARRRSSTELDMSIEVLSASPVILVVVDGRSLMHASSAGSHKGEDQTAACATLVEGSTISFNVVAGAPSPALRCFLMFRVHLTRADGASPQPAPSLASSCRSFANAGVAAVLECVRSDGCELERLPAETKVIPLYLGEAALIGRSQQRAVFEHLLASSQQYLTYISRNHCRVVLSRCHAVAGRPSVELSVENLSANVIFVNGQPVVVNGGVAPLGEGSILAFASDAVGSQPFLEFVLRRARTSA
eukprot:TRINITY_DN48131_c0_g1_i1.p1 TRINITY_DN48131_c0_g1~~TRINITY_DN48131_c0_g1_i1.p1  ORF type:complete len:446 (+),score=48.97 TRINITY_DN48131_c0_g1_i1:31-1338(+)